MDNNKKIIEKLTKYLLKCNFEYYNLNNSLITDLEYDSKLRELKILEEKYPNYKLKNTPTQNVGGFVNDNFVSKKHKYRLYSLQDIFSFSELEKFFKDTKKIIEHPVYSVELKIDGIAMVLNYKNGILDTAVTRGDAYIGEDVTENIKTIKSIPQYIKYEDDLEIRGEVYMPRESFEKYNDIIFNKKESLPKRVTNILKEYKIQENCVLKLYEENVIEDYIKIIKNNIKNFNDKEIRAYLKKEVSEISKINKEKMLSNPRNSASGSVRNLDTNITKNRNLSFIPYGTNIDGYNDINNNNSHLETVDYFVKELQFKKPITLKTNNEEEIRNFILSIENQRKDLPYDIDGIVVKVDDISFHEQIGYTAKFPKWAVAYKYEPIPAESILLDVIYQVGKTGAITPVAIIEPTEVSGSIISRVTLHNKKYILENNLKINNKIIVHKSGDVIPQIISSTETNSSKEIKFISKCPSCEENLDFTEIKTYCLNDDCPSKRVQKISHFCNRNNMDIASLSEKNIEQFVNFGLIKDVSDLYKLEVEDIINLPRFGLKSASKIIEEITISKERDLSNLISGLSIPNVGNKNAKYLGKVFKNMDNLINSFNENNLILNYLEDFSTTLVQSIKNYINTHSEVIKNLKEQNVNMKSINNNNYMEENKLLLDFTFSLINDYVDSTLVPNSKKEKYKKLLKNKKYNNISKENIRFEQKLFSKKIINEYVTIVHKLQKEQIISLSQEEEFLNIILEKQNQNKWSNKKIVITGTFSKYKRKEIENIIETLGGSIVKSIASTTDYLIYGDKAGSKLEKAIKLNINLIDQEQFYKFLGE